MSKGIIYCAHSLKSGKKYIGKTKNSLKRRQTSHLYASKNKNTGLFQNAIRKYGWDNFVWGIIEECDLELLSEREIFWINFYKTNITGYNLTMGGDGGFRTNQIKSFTVKSPEGKIYKSKNIAKFCQDHNLNPSCLGCVINGKRKSHKGWCLPETKIYGSKIRSEKISKNFKLMSPEGIIYEGKNITKFAKKMGLTACNLNMVINGKYKSHKGWTLPLDEPTQV